MRDTPLTSDERARLPEFITHWARIGLSAQPIEHSAAERAIAALYAWAGLPKRRIVWAPCPMTGMIEGDSRGRCIRSARRGFPAPQSMSRVLDGGAQGVAPLRASTIPLFAAPGRTRTDRAGTPEGRAPHQ